MLLWSLASSLPSSLVGLTDKFASLGNSLGGSFAASSAVTGSVGQLWNQTKIDEGEGNGVGGHGHGHVVFEEGLRDRIGEYIFKDSVKGLGQESQLVLKNGVEKDGWSDWKDVDLLAPRLVDAVRSAAGAGAAGGDGNGGGVKLKIDIFFAEKDLMIGDAETKGPKWFEKCWSEVEGVEFSSEVVKGSDHDKVWDLRWGAMEKVFRRMTTD